MGMVVNPGRFGGGGAATPTFVALGNGAGGTGTNTPPASSVNVPYPAGIAAGDIGIIQYHYNDQNLTTPSAVIATPSGWTAAGTQVDQQGMSAMVFWKRLTGSESGTVTVSQSGGFGSTVSSRNSGGRMSVWRGCVASGTPFEGYGTTKNTSTSPGGPSVVTTGANRRVLSLLEVYLTGNTSSPSAGWTEDGEWPGTGNNNWTIVTGSIEALAAGTQAGDSRTITSARWVNFGLALIPA